MDASEEMLRLMREIHAKICGGEVAQKSKRDKRYFGNRVLALMEPDMHYIAETFVEPLKALGFDKSIANINAALVKLAADNKIVRVRSGIYRLSDAAQKEVANG